MRLGNRAFSFGWNACSNLARSADVRRGRERGYKRGGKHLKPIKCDLPKEIESATIIPLSDIHLGDMSCDFKLLQSRIDYIANTPNAYCILSGDLMNTATKTSVSDVYRETINPMEQLKQCVKVFGPIRDKILCIVPGNHELRTYKTEGIDLTALMATQLDLYEKYSETTALLFIRLGSNTKGPDRQFCYTAYVTHGSGGGRKEGGKINRLADLAAIVDADIYIHSHSHFPAVFKEGYFRVDRRNSTFAMVDKLFVNTAAHMDYGGYGDLQAYKPSSKDTPVIHLSGKTKSATATL